MSGAGLTSFIAIWDGRMALTFSRGPLKPLEGTGLHDSLQSALHKAASALPPPGLDYVRRMQDSFSVGLGPHKAYRQHRETVARLQQAIEKRRTVQMPLGFDIQAYVRDALVLMRGRPITVDLLFDRQTAAGVKDRAWHPSQVLTPQKQGRLTMTLQVADTPELAGWILSFGSGVQVLGPDSLREKVLAEARKILGQA